MRTPPLPSAKAEYLRTGLSEVEGWLNYSAGVYVASLDVLQRRAGLHGDMCEIGVHHGKSFLCMALGLPDGERAVAIDVFGDQAANLDRSGRGDQDAFEGHLIRHEIRDQVDVIAESSLSLRERGFVADGRRFRMFSVDGGHTAEVTRNDLDLAERTIVDGGLVLLDDVLNRHWLGVVSGLFEYWASGGSLVPSVLLPDRLVLSATPDQAQSLRLAMHEQFAEAVEKQDVPFGPGTVDVYAQASWVVVDEAGGQVLVLGPPSPRADVDPRLVAQSEYIHDLEAQVKDLDARLRAPLYREIARRYPRLARPARRVLAPLLRLRSGHR